MDATDIVDIVAAQDIKHSLATKPIQGFDLLHQLARLRYAKSISDREAEAIFRALAENLYTYDHVTEVRSCCVPRDKTLTTPSSAIAPVLSPAASARPAATELRALPSTRGGARSDGRHLQRASCIPCKSLPRIFRFSA